jgi:hypothetical protein
MRDYFENLYSKKTAKSWRNGQISRYDDHQNWTKKILTT